MLLFIAIQTSVLFCWNCFNTSHVTLYLVAADRFPVLVAAFQYISCYSLSKLSMKIIKLYIYFNTSHVTLYLKADAQLIFLKVAFQYISCYSLSPRFSNLFPANLLYNIAKHKGLQYFSQAA